MQTERFARSTRSGLSNRSTNSQISRATQGLRGMLLRGDFRPGQRIAEIPVAAALGVSRSPLRLALEKLEHEGLLTALAPGFAACEFSIDDVRGAIEARGILEGAAARLAAERYRDSSQLEPLRKLNREVDEMVRVGIDGFMDQYLDMNRVFHAAIVELAGNGKLRAAIEQLYNYPFAMPTVPATTTIVPLAQEQHRTIVEAIEQRQGARADAIAREHAWVTWRNIELSMSDLNVWQKVPGANLVKFRDASGPARAAAKAKFSADQK